MGLFKKIFGASDTSKKEEKKIYVQWIPLKTMEQLEAISTLSKTETVAIFKHSTRCGISRSVVKMFEQSFTEDMLGLKVFYLDLLNYRDLSNEVGYKFQVMHQSPQLLVIKNEIAIAYASHYDIMAINLKELI